MTVTVETADTGQEVATEHVADAVEDMADATERATEHIVDVSLADSVGELRGRVDELCRLLDTKADRDHAHDVYATHEEVAAIAIQPEPEPEPVAEVLTEIEPSPEVTAEEPKDEPKRHSAGMFWA